MNDVSRCSQLAAAQRGSYISACLIRVNTQVDHRPLLATQFPLLQQLVYGRKNICTPPTRVFYRTHMQPAKQTTRAVIT